MRRTVLILAVIATPAFAQQQQSVPAANVSVSAAKFVWQMAHNNVLRASEQVPESLYSFRATPLVRSFGQILGHVAGAEYMFCAAALGETPRAEDDIEKSKTTKADLVAALKASATYCDRAYAMSDAASAANLSAFPISMTKMGALVMNAAHDMEHYGNLVTYMRLKGMVPPTSQR